jgi:hypothetical protein
VIAKEPETKVVKIVRLSLILLLKIVGSFVMVAKVSKGHERPGHGCGVCWVRLKRRPLAPR